MIVALAGRRVDPPDSPIPRFPLERAPQVRQRVFDLLQACGASALVCSAACGADLLALDAAGELGLRRRVVLPLEPIRFRSVSVVDRPGAWGELFDRITHEVGTRGDLVILSKYQDDEAAFAAANSVILDEALALARDEMRSTHNLAAGVLAVVVWDGLSRGEGDLTEAFLQEARDREVPVDQVATR